MLAAARDVVSDRATSLASASAAWRVIARPASMAAAPAVAVTPATSRSSSRPQRRGNDDAPAEPGRHGRAEEPGGVGDLVGGGGQQRHALDTRDLLGRHAGGVDQCLERLDVQRRGAGYVTLLEGNRGQLLAHGC